MKRNKWIVSYTPDGTKSVCVYNIYSDEKSANEQAQYMSEMYAQDTWFVTKSKFFDKSIKAYKCGMPIDPPL